MSKAGRPDQPHAAERFNEERATYTVKGSQPDLEAGVAAIREVHATLKPKPGVYRMLDARGEVLYVGKARALKNRVANYIQVDRLPLRLKRMVAQTRAMTIVTTNSEAEALLLEAQLIKRYRPPYNVLLRDDKSFPFILLRADHDYPRITKHRGARKAKGNYYGPFASAGSVNTTINALQKLFLLRSCTDSFFARRDRPCLLYQIKRCSAPCVGRIDEASYAELVSEAKDFLGGRSSAVQRKLEDQMAEAAEALDFERAAMLRDRLRAATFIQGSQAVNAEGVGNADVFAIACKGGHFAIQAFFIRGGQNWGHRAFFPGHTEGLDEGEVLTAFLAYISRFYTRLDSMSRIVSVTQKAASGAKRIFDILDHVSSVPEPAKPVHLPQISGRIELRDVGFRYGNRAVSRGVSLDIQPGEMIGLVGHSGSGKSTALKLVAGDWQREIGVPDAPPPSDMSDNASLDAFSER